MLLNLLMYCSSLFLACNTSSSEFSTNPATGTTIEAKVTKVKVTGKAGAYTFSVTIKSSDTGCNQYANWWEVISTNGKLLYRRILAHSHVGEQPFTRSGGSVSITATDTVIVRAHMNTTGYSYGNIAFKGTIEGGFAPYSMPVDFYKELENIDPQPSGCAF